MSWLDGLRHRARTLLHPRDYARDAEEEMALHLELDAMQQGDAYAARRRLGNRTYHMEERRRMTWLAFFDGLRQDTTYAWRSIRRSPGLTVAVVATLALGIGVNAASFAVLDLLYLRPPAGVPEPSGLRRLWLSFPMTGNWVSSSGDAQFVSDGATFPLFSAMRSAAPDTMSIALYTGGADASAGHADTHVTYATSNYFHVVGARPALGRVYRAEEDVLETGGAKVAVVSDRYWRARLGSDTTAIGRPITIGKNVYRVIGVMQPGFGGVDLQATDVWIPFAAQPPPRWMPTPRWWENEYNYSNKTVMRVSPSLNVAAFQGRATAAVRAHLRSRPHASGDTLMTVAMGSIKRALGPQKPDQEQVIGTRLGGVAIIVLLIACANVLNLLLARAIKRRREIAVRLALGMSRWRLVRLLTTETVLLALIASAGALLICWWAGTLLRTLLLPQVDWYEGVVQSRIIWFTLAVGVASGVMAGLVPALQSSSPQLTPALKEGTRETTGHRPARLRAALVVVQAALSIVLLAGAALFVRSLRNVTGIDIGFDREQLVLGWTEFAYDTTVPSPVVQAGLDRVHAEIMARPDVAGVARAWIQPMNGFSTTPQFTSTDSVQATGDKYPTFNAVSPNFFDVAGLRVLRGTTLDARERTVVVNDAMARQVWPGKDVVGECLYLGKRASECYRVTGVVENGRRASVMETDVPLFYVPLGVGETVGSVLVVRARPGAAVAVATAIRDGLRRALPNAPPTAMPMAEMLDGQYRPWRLGAQLFTAVGLLALVVALVGIYSTVSYGVSQRTQEFGVRVALGARTADVLRQVLGEGLRVVVVGIGVGVGLTLLGGRLVAALLYGVKPNDAETLAVVAAALLATAAAAALIPAWRASRVDPASALRAE